MQKLTLKDKLGYGSAAVGDAVAYTAVTTFILFFLTTVAGIQPATAGTLTIIGSVWNALFNPVMGYISDNSKSSRGRRRPFMFGFCFPLCAAMILLFTAVEMNYTIKVLYYGLIVVAFWTSFTGFFVPFYALGAEYTQDYEERTLLRSFASFFNMIGTLFSMAMPTMVVDLLSRHGISQAHAWTITAAMLALVAAVSILITVKLSADKDSPLPREDSEDQEDKAKAQKGKLSQLGSIFRDYMQVLSLKPMKMILLATLFFLISYTMLMSDFVYMMTYNMAMTGSGVSGAMLFRCLVCMIIIFPTAWLCRVSDKRTAMMIIMALSCVCLTALRFLTIDSILMLGIFIAVTAIATATYWQIMPAMYYDICEYDEYVTGQQRQGAIVSVQGLVEAVSGGIGAQILGIILQCAGFDGSKTVQSARALEWVYNCTSWVPVIFIAASAVFIFMFPITKKKHSEITAALAEKRAADRRKKENAE